MLKTSFPDVAAISKTYRIRVFRNDTGRAPERRSKAPHKFMDSYARARLCAKLERVSR